MSSTAMATSVDGSREKLLASAERLFAERGFSGVSVRDIASGAGVNSALVGYYFGNKLGLLSTVYLRHCKPLNQERLRLLREFSHQPGGATLEQVLEAFLRPALVDAPDDNGRSEFTRLRSIISGENSALLEDTIAENFDRPGRTFIDALARCLPHLTREDVLWRFHFLLGSLYHTGAHASRICILSGGQCDPSNAEASLAQLIPFMAAAFRSPQVQIETADSLSYAAV